ncbi:MAG: ABC transporter substrate-binding protein [Pseudomonadota bacterium]
MMRISMVSVAALAVACLSGSAWAQDNGTLVISTWGFNGDLLEEHLYAPFEEEHGVEIVIDSGNNADRLSRARIRDGGDIDLIYLADAFTQQAIDDGLFAAIDRSQIPNIEQIYPIAQAPHGEEYGPAYTVGRYGIIYDSAATDTPVTSWGDLWRDEFAGQITIPGINTTAGQLIVIAAADQAGVDAFEDPDAAFASLAELAPNLLTTYGRSSELVNLFAQGEVVIAPAQDFAFGRIQDAVPTAVWAELDEGAFANLNAINVLASSDQLELAHAFINWHLDADVQQTMAEVGVDAPVNVNVQLDPETAARWTYGQAVIDSLRTPDYAQLNAVRDDWTDRWNDVIAQ